MKTCLAFRHVPFEDLDGLGPPIERAGFRIRYVDTPVEDPAGTDALAPDLLVVLGGPIGVYEVADYPFLAAEIAAVARRLAADRSTLGICLGAQVIAAAAGASVYPGGRKEIGWSPLVLTDAGHSSPLAEIGGRAVLHWHGDTFELPERATLLASTEAYPHQAFALGAQALGLQFHLEASAPALERWYVGHAVEIAAAAGVSVAGLRAQAAAAAPALAPAAARFIDRWLQRSDWT